MTTNSTTIDTSSFSNRFNQMSMRNDYENDNVIHEIQKSVESDKSYTNLPSLPDQQRPQPAMRPSKSSTILQPTVKSTGAIKKIPENLKLKSDDKINNNHDYRSSGPYIPLSDCFSGSPVLFVSKT